MGHRTANSSRKTLPEAVGQTDSDCKRTRRGSPKLHRDLASERGPVDNPLPTRNPEKACGAPTAICEAERYPVISVAATAVGACPPAQSPGSFTASLGKHCGAFVCQVPSIACCNRRCRADYLSALGTTCRSWSR